jgi:hypothetical protein
MFKKVNAVNNDNGILHYMTNQFSIWGYYLGKWFSNGVPRHTGEPEEMARCAMNIMKVYILKMRRNPFVQIFITSMIFIFIHSLKYINIFLILYTKCTRKLLYVLQCAANKKSLRTIDPGMQLRIIWSGNYLLSWNLNIDHHHKSINCGLSHSRYIKILKMYWTIWRLFFHIHLQNLSFHRMVALHQARQQTVKLLHVK